MHFDAQQYLCACMCACACPCVCASWNVRLRPDTATYASSGVDSCSSACTNGTVASAYGVPKIRTPSACIACATCCAPTAVLPSSRTSMLMFTLAAGMPRSLHAESQARVRMRVRLQFTVIFACTSLPAPEESRKPALEGLLRSTYWASCLK